MSDKETSDDGLKNWNSKILMDILAESPIKCTTTISKERGGDWDLNAFNIEIENCDDGLILTPFVDPDDKNGAPLEDEDVLIYALVLRSYSSDSRGGCQTNNTNLGMLYGFLKSKLTQAGFFVVNHYDEIF